MNILFITSFVGNKGGLGRYGFETVKALRQEGARVSILGEANQFSSSDSKNALIPVLRLSGLAKLRALALNCLRSRREAQGYDIVHAADGWPYAIYGYFAVIGTHKKLFVSGVGTYTIAPLAERSLQGWLIRKAYARAIGILCISDYVRDQILHHMPEAKAKTVLMGTNALPAIPPDRLEAFKKENGLEGRHPIVLTVGDIKHRKGQLDTLKALAMVKGAYPHFLYVMIGNAEDSSYVSRIRAFAAENGIAESVRIISGMHDDAELAAYYQSCDIFALDSNNDGVHCEGFGLVLLEAAQFGKPAVGSRGCGIESAIRDGETGFLAEQGDPGDIAGKIGMILQKGPASFAPAARAFQAGFSWKKTAQGYLRYYSS